MVDFKKLVRKERAIDVTNIERLFESLDRQTSHTDLRPTQVQALEALSRRRGERNLVLKMSTGSGKTASALLYLLSHMEEKERPVVYLCPTTQLVEQVKDEASKMGIKAVIYPAGEPYPDADGISAKAIIICTYDKLFNAKTTFDRPDVYLRPCALVLDDAHAGIEEVRDAFTLRISKDEGLYAKLLDLLGPSCEKYDMGLWQSILNKDPYASLEIPYWIWHPLNNEVQKLFSPHAEDGNFKFVWPYLRDLLKRCRCIISYLGIEIIPDILPVHKINAYIEANHRLFMSATLADDSVLIRELGCDITAAQNPIIPKNDKGIGERMVIAPSLVNKEFNREWVMKQCKILSKKVRVVVLSPSEWAAREWESVGAKVVLGDEVTLVVKELKSSLSNLSFVVFVQRYDGVDLPDNACRILVIDGLPYGEGIADKYDSQIAAVAGGIRNRLIYRIEQGMGRAVRSHVDYAVVILSGPDIAHFIAKKDVLDAMNPDTRAQLKLASDLSKLALEEGGDDPEKALVDMISQCLKRYEGWKQFYGEYINNARAEESKKSDDTRMIMADAERRAFNAAIANNCLEAVKILSSAINRYKLNEKDEGWYLQKIANYVHELNPGDALEKQRAAYEKNNSMFRPPTIVRRPSALDRFDVQGKIINWFREFVNPNGAIAAIQDLRARLSYAASPNTIEEAIKELAQLLGAVGSRPEKELREGPDNLWLWSELSLVIEVKNENKETLHKKDAGQLALSLQWFKKSYPTLDNGTPVVVAKVLIADQKAGFPDGTRVLTQEKMQELLNRLEGFYQTLINEPPLLLTPSKISDLQDKIGISPKQFLKNFTLPLKERK